MTNNLDEFIDAYHHMYSERNDINRIVVTPDYVMENWDNITYAMRILYLYPDYFIDIVKRKNTYLQQLFFYQRVFLRVLTRFQKVSGIFVRAYSKSFMNFMAINMKAMWQPMSKLFICADTKKQAAMITKEKMAEVYYLIPFFVNELDIAEFDKQKQHYSTGGEDQAKLKFRNQSVIDIVATTDSARGGRRHGGVIEEFSLANQDEIENVVIPLLNVNRKTMAGLNNPTEPHASQIMIGSAGYKNTYAYNVSVEMLVDMVFEPDKVFVFGGDYRVPVMHGLLDKRKIMDKIKSTGTYKLETFLREYMSRWAGGSEESYYSYTLIDKRRKILRPEFEPEKRKDVFYTLSVDVGRFSDETVLEVFKTYTEGERFVTHLVNIIILAGSGRHFQDQSIKIKQLDAIFNFRGIVVDINGPGAGIADFLIIDQEKDGMYYPAYGFSNKPKYKKTEMPGCIRKLYGVEASSGANSDYYKNAHLMLSLDRVRLLINERQARSYFARFGYWNKMKVEKKATQLIPYIATTKLQDQLANLKANLETATSNINIQKIKTSIGKDLVSSFIYGLWFIGLEEEKELKKRAGKGTLGQYSFYN